MTRSASALDRLAAVIFGLALIAVGVGLLVWNTNWIAGIPQMITAPGLVTAAPPGGRGQARRHRAGGDGAALAVQPYSKSESQRSAPVRWGRRIDLRGPG